MTEQDPALPPPDPTPPSAVPSDPRPGSSAGLLLVVLGIATAVLLASLSFLAGVGLERFGFLDSGGAASTESATRGDSELALIEEAWGLLHTKFVAADSLDSRKMAYAAINALAEAVDDTGHTAFLTPEELASADDTYNGFGGIGATMDTVDDEAVIVGVIRGSPAERAGLRAGDVVVEVDGEPMAGKDLGAVVTRIRGPEGTTVTLVVRRTGAEGPITVRIVRETIKVPTVASAMVPGSSIGLVGIGAFTSGAGDELRSAIRELQAQRPTGLILDLRGNLGGLLDEVVPVASEFLASGPVYRARDADGKETVADASSGGLATAIPLVVLVDSRTASASEIVAGALQDADRATIVGARTFGTGTVLETFFLRDGSALRIGTVEWLTPKGRVIWREGIAPDVAVELASDVQAVAAEDLPGMTAAEVRDSEDAQLLKALAILLGRAY